MRVTIQQQGQGKVASMVMMLLLCIGPAIALAQITDFTPSTNDGAAKEPMLVRTDSNTSINFEDLEKVLAKSSILASFREEQTLSFYDATFKTLTKSEVLLQANPEVLVAVVLLGKIQNNGETAEAGEAIAWPLGGGNVEVMEYDAGRFLASAPIGLKPDVLMMLETVADHQERLMFWGLREKVSFNLKAPGGLGIRDHVQRSYLSNPEVLRLRRSHTEPKALAQGVVKTFTEGLRKGNRQPVEALLNPLLFTQGGVRLGSSLWNELRGAYADLLMAQPWADRLAESKIVPTEEVGLWAVSTSEGTYNMILEPLDNMIFVTSFAPVEEESL